MANILHFFILQIQPVLEHQWEKNPSYRKRVIFPSGFVVSGDVIYVSYGKDDLEIWIASIDKKRLQDCLVPVNP